MCLDGSNLEGVVKARLHVSIAKNPSTGHTCMEGPRGPRLGVRRQRCCSRCGRIGKHMNGVVRVVMYAV